MRRPWPARYEFLSFRDPPAGGAWLAGILRQGAVGRGSRGPSVDAGQPLGDRGLHLERAAGARRGRGVAGDLPGGVPAGHGGPRRDPRRHGRESSRPLGGRPGQPGPPRHRHPLRPRRRGARALRSRSTEQLRRAVRRAWRCSRRSTSRRRRRSTTRTTTSATATGCRSRSSKASGDEPTPGSGAPLKAGEFILGYPDEDGITCQSAAARDPVPQRQLHGLPPPGGARRRVSRLPARARQDARGAGTGRGEAHGPLAQRRAAGPGARTRTIRRSAPIRSGTTTSTTRRWTRTATPCRSARTSGA